MDSLLSGVEDDEEGEEAVRGLEERKEKGREELEEPPMPSGTETPELCKIIMHTNFK